MSARFQLRQPVRVQKNPEDIGRCGCGRREYCDGSHGLTAEQWQIVQAREAERKRNESISSVSEIGGHLPVDEDSGEAKPSC